MLSSSLAGSWCRDCAIIVALCRCWPWCWRAAARYVLATTRRPSCLTGGSTAMSISTTPSRARVRDVLGQWFAWHRAHPAARLRRPAGSARRPKCWPTPRPSAPAAGGPSCAGAASWPSTRRCPAAAELMLTLSRRADQHIERALLRKRTRSSATTTCSADPAQRLKDSVKRTLERAEVALRHAGRRAARARRPAGGGLAVRRRAVVAERQRRQQEMLQMLRRLSAEPASPRHGAGRAARLRRSGIERSPREPYRRYQQNAGRRTTAPSRPACTTPPRRRSARRRRSGCKGWEGRPARALAADRGDVRRQRAALSAGSSSSSP